MKKDTIHHHGGIPAALLVMMAFYCSLASTVVAGEEFVVGGAKGWRRPDQNHTEMYLHWSSNRRFHVGDSIRFEYKNDSVMEVDKWGYYHCDATHPISAADDGNTTVYLDRSGPFYFTSGNYDHCKDGQRLQVQVLPLHDQYAPPPAMSPFSSPTSHSGGAFLPSPASFSVFIFALISVAATAARIA
ncbi:unnamed protein product [Cuscuta campestris]|uniref:Phytocyanin domain-containing protein n=1 Tax=Cuscuta campestris TaxID=132261 RepID=A0A484MCZ0_9ASTE|nr:unnamed protein product [Cuscuta campestris]